MNPSKRQPRQQRNALTLAACLTCAAAIALPIPAIAQTEPATEAAQSETRNYDIPAGPLDQALSHFISTSGVYLAGIAELTEDRHTQGVRGDYTVHEALERLLADTGLRYRETDTGTLALERVPDTGSIQLAPIGVTASTPGFTTEGSDSYTSSEVTIGRGRQRVRDIPQSVSVVTRERMDDQAATTLADAMEHTAGMTVERSGPNAFNFTSRGYPIGTLLIDGSPIRNQLGVRDVGFDTAIADRVEVLRGPTGLLQGSGEPSGSINLARKRALETPGVDLTASAGSWDAYRGELDVTGAIDESGRLRGRAVLVYDDRNSYIDHVYATRRMGYGTLEYDLSSAATASAGFIIQDGESRSHFGIPNRSDGELMDVSRSTYLGARWDRRDERIERYFAELDVALDNGADLHLHASHTERRSEMMQSSAGSSFVEPGSSTAEFFQWAEDATYQDQFVDAYLTTPVDLLGRVHQLTVGASHRISDHQFDWGSGDPQYIERDITAPDRSTPRPSFEFAPSADNKTDETGLYTQGRFHVTDSTAVIGGGRLTWWNTRDRLNPDNSYRINREFTPYAGVIQDISPALSLYGSYSSIFQPQTAQDADGDSLQPRTGNQVELGIKGEHFGQQLNWHAAAFRITDEDRAVAHPDTPGASVAAGKARSEGVELEIAGELLPRWDITAGYAYTRTEYLRDPDQEGLALSPETPRHNLNLWTRYRFSDNRDRGWRVGAGLRTTSGVYAESGDTRWSQGGYTLVSAMAGYRFNPHLDLALNGRNLTDRKYYARVAGNTRGSHYGEPRNVMLTLRYTH
ncbi:TonB-dependent siderophore receptor [Aquisalimonas asiatica]|uniref:Outer-membrane receptor for ferric coprogen and ferric-rhodotorulic acid n=1 Tax=Aquisalimonas asiatica TaxID=406100 RepID=A0A1H8SWV3_9GAMM|nr:TonB-dependent siderophore receptor [Aquisalimonas asiatica]SEO83469.1 outer-membrane receptor for ferric coprogen and ferric-rhodotorulic acid [Aquisalimonas asiatica]